MLESSIIVVSVPVALAGCSVVYTVLGILLGRLSRAKDIEKLLRENGKLQHQTRVLEREALREVRK